MGKAATRSEVTGGMACGVCSVVHTCTALWHGCGVQAPKKTKKKGKKKRKPAVDAEL